MLRLKGSGHIRTNRMIKGFRSCKHFTGIPLMHFEPGRITFEEERLGIKQVLRRSRLQNLGARCHHRPERVPFMPGDKERAGKQMKTKEEVE